MICALHMMKFGNSTQKRYENSVTSKVYARNRRKYSDALRVIMKGRTGRTPWNKGKSVGPHSKESNRLKSISLKNRFTGDKNSSAKAYQVTDPMGNIYVVVGRLKLFCNEHEISINAMRRALKLQKITTSGWAIEYLNCDK